MILDFGACAQFEPIERPLCRLIRRRLLPIEDEHFEFERTVVHVEGVTISMTPATDRRVLPMHGLEMMLTLVSEAEGWTVQVCAGLRDGHPVMSAEDVRAAQCWDDRDDRTAAAITGSFVEWLESV